MGQQRFRFFSSRHRGGIQPRHCQSIRSGAFQLGFSINPNDAHLFRDRSVDSPVLALDRFELSSVRFVSSSFFCACACVFSPQPPLFRARLTIDPSPCPLFGIIYYIVPAPNLGVHELIAPIFGPPAPHRTAGTSKGLPWDAAAASASCERDRRPSPAAFRRLTPQSTLALLTLFET